MRVDMGLKERLDPSNYGIFADSEALAWTDHVETEMDEEGYSKSRSCELCSSRKKCQMTWSELYCLQFGVLPQEVGRVIGRVDLFPTPWVYNRRYQCFHPEYRCGCDPRALVIFDVTPTEAERIFNQAARNGVIGNQQAQMVRAIDKAVQAIRARRQQVGVQR